ncbi:MAG: hypothetical protein Q7I99_08745, partial [Acholeplasmataceae bacterium]|nr:hypothetical protein [Acholeplasmataceae bacterium]
SDVAAQYKPGFNYQMIENNVFYLVATNEYIFDKVDNPFIYGDNPIDTGVIIRDVLETVLRNQAKIHDYFYIENPIVLAFENNVMLHIFEEKSKYVIL